MYAQAVPGAFAIEKRGVSPCRATCPAHVSVQGYLALTAQGRYREALKLIKEQNPLPAVCGRVCHHPCESECGRGKLDEPVAIDSIKRFLADLDLDSQTGFVRDFGSYSLGETFLDKLCVFIANVENPASARRHKEHDFDIGIRAERRQPIPKQNAAGSPKWRQKNETDQPPICSGEQSCPHVIAGPRPVVPDLFERHELKCPGMAHR